MKNKGCVFPFFLLFGAAGLMAGYFIVGLCIDAVQPRFWEQVKGEVILQEGKLDPAADEFSPPFSYRTRYRYQYQSQSHDSEESGTTRDWLEISYRQRKYPPGGTVTVYVNPADPKQNYLELPDLWVFLLLLFPVPFLAVPVLAIYSMRRTARAEPRPPKVVKLSGRAQVIIYCCLVLVGGGIFFGFIYDPAVRAVRSWNWPQTEATVEFSRISVYSGSKGGRTYAADVLFSYRVNGVAYKSSRYSLENVSTSDREGEEAIVQKLPVGARALCYYDPARPEWAVIDNSFPGILFLGLIPLLIFVLGAIALLRRLLRIIRPEPPPSETPSAFQTSKVLRPVTTKFGRFAGCLIFVVFWNGGVAFLIAQVIRSWRTHSLDIGEIVIAALFGSIGLLGALGAIYYFLALFTPRPQITLTPPAPRIGGHASVEWRFKGLAWMLRRVRITVEGSENKQAGSKRGSSSEKEVFRRIELVDTTEAAPGGTVSLSLPRDTMPTFEGDHFKIAWELKVEGEIPFWADVDETFPLDVQPGSGSGWEAGR